MAYSAQHGPIGVLVVEDEMLVRMDAIDMIEEAGFKAYGAGSAHEAITLLERQSDIHILFTDVDMPGLMDGLKLARYVRDRWPPVQLIVTSGHRTAASELPDDSVFFTKPYAIGHIMPTLQLMARQAGRRSRDAIAPPWS